MVCKITSIKESGAVLVEAVIGIAVSTIVLGSMCAFSVYTGQNLATFYNFVDAGQNSRVTMNQMSKDFRMAASVTNVASETVSLVMVDGSLIRYDFDVTNATVIRRQGTSKMTLLKDCSRFGFAIFSRNLTNGTFDYYPCTNLLDCKAIQVNWCCTSKILNRTVDDIPHTATFVIRNKS
jgi:hypothetical protein